MITAWKFGKFSPRNFPRSLLVASEKSDKNFRGSFSLSTAACLLICHFWNNKKIQLLNIENCWKFFGCYSNHYLTYVKKSRLYLLPVWNGSHFKKSGHFFMGNQHGTNINLLLDIEKCWKLFWSPLKSLFKSCENFKSLLAFYQKLQLFEKSVQFFATPYLLFS